MTDDSRCHKEIKRRIALGKVAFAKRRELLKGQLDLQLKKRLVKAFIWSMVLYGSETWTLLKEDIKRLEAFEMWIWRRIMKISWTEHKTNEEVLKMVNEKRSLIDTIRGRQKNWICHILRGDSLLRTVLEGRMEGKRTRGRPRTMLLDWMMDKTENYQHVKEKARNGEAWHHWVPGRA